MTDPKLPTTDDTEVTETAEGAESRDPSNTPIDELTDALHADDDVHERVALVNTSTDDDLSGAQQ